MECVVVYDLWHEGCLGFVQYLWSGNRCGCDVVVGVGVVVRS